MAQITLTMGSLLLVLTYPVLLYLFILSQKPILVIISLLSALFYIVALLITALIMFPIPVGTSGTMDPAVGESDLLYPTLAVIIGSLSQEFCRFAFIFMFRKVEKGFRSVINSPSVPKSILVEDPSICLASGMGIATAHMLTTAGFVFAATIPRAGDFFGEMCNDIPLQYLTAITALEFFVLDIALMVIAFRAEKHRSIVHFLVVFIFHIAAGFCTMSNVTLGSNVNCSTSVYSALAIVIVTILYIVFVPVDFGRSLMNNTHEIL